MATLTTVLNTLSSIDDAVIDYDSDLIELNSGQLLNHIAQRVRATNNINSTNDYGASTLIIAAATELYSLAEELIYAGANLNLRDNSGYTALDWACYTNDIKIAMLLIQSGADLFHRNDNYNTSSLDLIARFTGNIELAKIILDAATQRDQTNSLTKTIVRVSDGPSESVYVIFDNQIGLNSAVLECLSDRLIYNPHKLISLFVTTPGFNVQSSHHGGIGDIVLHYAITKGYKELVVSLINAGVDIQRLTYLRSTPLIKAIEHDQLEIVRILLDARVDITLCPALYTTALSMAVRKNNRECICLIMQCYQNRKNMPLIDKILILLKMLWRA